MEIPEKFSVDQAFVINILFFFNLWPLVEPKVIKEEKITKSYSLFFIIICPGGECSAEWNEAVRIATHIPKEEQKTLKLSLPEIFLCALEFCKLYNKRYESEITYAVQLLESMKKEPEKYKNEWQVWQNAVDQTVTKHMNSDELDWSAKLPIESN